jgi:hypothetical protein
MARGAAREYVVDVVCRDVKDGKVGPALSQASTELATIHAGHDDVGDNQVDWLRGSFHELQGFPAVTCL